MEGREVVRVLVDSYYQWQERRKALANQWRAIKKGQDVGFTDGLTVIERALKSAKAVEEDFKSELGKWVETLPEGRWLMAQIGIGPVLASGLLAHLDITKASHRSSFWRFAGLDPTAKWEKGQKRPWNADLKVICWRIGDSFVKQSGRDNCFYGQVYRDAKDHYLDLNESGHYAELCREELQERGNRMSKGQRAHYEAGHLPPGRIDLMARRKAVKLLLAHLWEIMRETNGLEVHPPYPVAHDPGKGHEWIKPPMADVIRQAA